MNIIEWAKEQLSLLNPDNKFTTMLFSAAIITKVLDIYGIKPIVVGGFSIEIYTHEDYSTRDIDFVCHRIDEATKLLQTIGFEKEGRDLFDNRLEIVVEFPDNTLAGSYEKVVRVDVDTDKGLYVYVISVEDIIMDRLRASIHWNESESKEWGMRLLAEYYDEIDLDYMQSVGKGSEIKSESEEIRAWIKELEELNVLL